MRFGVMLPIAAVRHVLSVLALVACSREPARVVADPVDATPTKPAPAPAPEKKEPPKSVSCENDKDCGWDDQCFPTACVGNKPMQACDESAPRPGACVCAMGTCTLLPKTPVSTKTGCKSNAECAFEPATGTCAAGTRAFMISERGAFCTCAAGSCTPQIVERVACSTDAECSFLEDPLRPAPAAKVPRLFPPSKPCSHGSRDSVCRKGTCVVMVWKC